MTADSITCQPMLDFEPTTLHSARLLLRPLRASDAGPLSLYASDERVATMTTSIPHPYPPGAADAYIAASLSGRSPEIIWAMDATPDNGAELIGVVAVKRAKAELGYWVGPPFWGTGYASEAATRVCEHLMTDHKLDRLNASVFFDNPASRSVLQHCGFRQTGDAWQYSVARQMEVPAVTFELTKLPAAA